ncbi:putative 50S ribosomal protein L2 [Streptomyces sp. Tu6071]|nr:putative 50S ribosomal protein L2 [Streptomyces sp. Tu6071]
MTPEGARRRELAELVADHGLGDKHRDVGLAVVHRDRVAEHGRDDHRATGPGLDDVLGAGFVLYVHLLDEVVVDEGPLLETARHLNPLLALLVRLAAADDVLAARLLGRARTTLLLTPGADRVATTGGLALTTTVGVVNRVHRHTANGRAHAQPALAAGLAPVDVRLLGVADLTDGGAAARVHHADLAGRHAEGRHGALASEQLHGGTGGAGELRAATGTELDRVDRGTDRDVTQRQVVAGLDVGALAVLDPVALLEAARRDDVALLAVGVVQQRDARGAVRVVLDVRDLRRHAVLVVTTEVDHSVGALVSATLVANGHTTGVVTAALAVQRADQRLLRRGPRDLDEVGDAGATTARSRRLVLADTHS